jgi:UDP-N-acetylmuramate--alanine ligase
MAPYGMVATCVDEPTRAGVPLARRRIRSGWAGHAEWRIERFVPRAGGGGQVTVRRPDGVRATYDLRLTGRHNAANAVAALAVCHELGVSDPALREGLATYQGTGRRFETLALADGIWVVDDYAHHPTAVALNLEAARDVHCGRLVAVFQPHTTHRTRALLDEFARAFSAADRVILTPIYQPTGRSVTAPEITADELAARIDHPDVTAAPSLDAAYALARAELNPGSLVLVMGAGDVTSIARRLAEAVRAGGSAVPIPANSPAGAAR